MNSPGLKEVIVSLQRDIAAALHTNSELESAVRLERITFSLKLAAHKSTHGDDAGFSFSVIAEPSDANTDRAQAPDNSSHIHTVTIEFARPKRALDPLPGNGAYLNAGQDPPDRDSGRPSEESAERIAESLAEIFGAPGFDSSARATVFREALAELPADLAASVIQSLDAKPASNKHDPAKTARHLIRGVLKSGPLKSIERGTVILRKLFSQFSVQLILQVVTAKWKTQDDWL